MTDINKIKKLYKKDHNLTVRIAEANEYSVICDYMNLVNMVQVDNKYYKVIDVTCEKEVVLKIKENYEKSETK